MQVLIVYSSEHDNTKEMAERIAQGVEMVDDVKCLVKAIEFVTKEDFIGSQGIIIGSPVYFGSMSGKTKAYIDGLWEIRTEMKNKVGAAFVTAANPASGADTAVLSILQTMLMSGMIIVGNTPDVHMQYGAVQIGSMDAKTALEASSLGQRVAETVKKIYQ